MSHQYCHLNAAYEEFPPFLMIAGKHPNFLQPKLIFHNQSHASEPSSYQCAGSANELRSFNARHDINLGACHHCGHSLSSFQKLAPPPLGLRLYILPYSAVTVNVSVVGTLE